MVYTIVAETQVQMSMAAKFYLNINFDWDTLGNLNRNYLLLCV